MGGSAIGGALARAALGDRASRPIIVDARLRRAVVDDARRDRAVRELLRQHRGDARRVRGGRRARRPPRSSRRPAASSPQRAREEDVPVIPLPGGFQPRAAVGYVLVVALEVAALVRRRPSRCTRRSTSPPRTPRSSSPSGAPTAPRTRCQAARARAARHDPADRGAGLTAPIAYRWKTQLNENAKIPALLRRAAGARPQRDRGLGGRGRARAASARSSSTTRDLHPRIRQRIELTRGLIGARGRLVPRREPRRDALERAGLARAARRPRLALPRRPARHRPDAGRRDRAAQGRADRRLAPAPRPGGLPLRSL